ncbi:MAG: two-component regulator propeller domain-containing protein [Bacteroidales bacterium]
MIHADFYNLRGIIRNMLLVIFFFSAIAQATISQTWYFEKYGPEQNLNTSRVFVSLQDSRDFIWLGTDIGLSRFDGSKIENYNVENGLAPDGVRSMCEDTLGRIWFGHLNGGISYFDGHKFIKAEFDDGHIQSDITSIRQNGPYLWVTTWLNGAMRINFPDAGDTLLIGKQYHGSEGLSDIVPGSYIDLQGNYYAITDIKGIAVFNPETDRFEPFSLQGLTREWQFTCMLEDTRGYFWFGTQYGGLYRIHKDNGDLKVFDRRDGLARNFVTCLIEDYRGDIWAGTWEGGGVSVFSGDQIRNYDNTNGLSAMNILSLMEDNEKNMFITDYAEGFSIYKGDHIFTIAGDDIPAGKTVNSIWEEPSGNIWLASNTGITVINPKEGMRPVALHNRYSTNYGTGENIRFLVPDSKGLVWVGTDEMGVSVYNPASRKFHWDSFLNSRLIWPTSQHDRRTRALTVDNRDRIWVGTSIDGAWLWDPEELTGYQYNSGAGLAGNLITVLFSDSRGNIWVGSENSIGLTKHTPRDDPEKGEFSIIDLGYEYKPRTITETPDGRIWVGTESGLIVLMNDTVDFKLTYNEGLLSNNIKQLLADGEYMYIGTNRGLNRYHITEGTIATFTRRNGFIGIEATPNGAFKDRQGRLWFGTTNGATVIDPGDFPPVNTTPMTHLSQMTVNRKPVEMNEGLRLGYRENTISFDYYSVCITNPDAVGYMVMLEGVEKTWRPVTTQTTAYYPSLAPGQYTFRVKASNSSGYWDEDPVSFSFVIRPPFYKASWFIILMVIAAFAITAMYIKIREMNLVREKKILEAKVKERTAEVVQKSQIIEEKNRDITASIRYAERIQRAMLPPDDLFPETFIFFRPKDIVSGDFYWMHDNGDYMFIAAVDCTGHGVPGAFMSIIGHNSLNKIVREYELIKPSAILDQLNNEVVKALLARHETTINDGMDLSLIALNKKKRTMEFAGAYNPLYVVRKREITVYKADRFPIGMSTVQEKKKFKNIDVNIASGDMIYLSSDGFADQFGGPDGGKYKSAAFKKLLTEISDMPVAEQKCRLDAEMLSWKGDLPQVDDILIIGCRII